MSIDDLIKGLLPFIFPFIFLWVISKIKIKIKDEAIHDMEGKHEFPFSKN